MNTISSFFKISWAVLFAFLVVSCETFLAEDPKGKLAPENYFSSRSDLDRATHALNQNVNYICSSEERVQAYAAGDDIGVAKNRTGNNQSIYDTYDKVQGNHGDMAEQWVYLFRVVKAANFIICNAGRTPVDQSVIDCYLANAYYWRAFAYFQLVTIWGPVPMLTTEGVDYAAPLASIEDIWTKLIFPDMEMAEKAPIRWSNVPNAANEASLGGNAWVTQQAAKATTAYLYLAYAGWPTNHTDYYAKAATKAKEVIDGVDNGTYPNGLMDEFWQNYSYQYKTNCKETLLTRYHRTNSGNWNAYDVLPGDVIGFNADGSVNTARGWTEFLAEIKFWKEFPEGPRKEQTYAQKTLINDDDDGVILVDWWDERRAENVRTPWFCKIIQFRSDNVAAYSDWGGEWHYSKGTTAVTGHSEKPCNVVRLSEVYCWYAEAVARSGQGDKAKAVEVLNKVRNRADQAQTNLYTTSMSNEALADAAVKEHGWEIAGDFYTILAPRSFDMFRLYLFEAHYNYRKANPGIEVAPGVIRKEAKEVPASVTWDPKNIYSAYPDADALINPNLIH